MITKNCLLLLCLCLGLSLSAQKSTKVKGFVKDGKLKEVKLYMVEDGAHKPCATTPVAGDGAYGFVFTPARAGFYTVGSDRMDFAIYVQGGEEININILGDKAELKGKNTRENTALYGWENFVDSIRLKSLCFAEYPCTYKEFFPEFTTFVTKIDSVKNSIHSGNEAFDALLKKKIAYDVDFYAANFLQTPRTIHPKRTDWPAYYKTIVSKDKFTTDEVLQFPKGIRMMQSYTLFVHMFSGQAYVDPKGYLDFCIKILQNDRLRGEFIVENELARLRSYDLYKKVMERYGKYFVTPSLKTRARVIGEQLALSASKVVTHDFTYPDVNGKKVSLSDFKGKVVVVDIWATWCSPCRFQIPHFKKLEEELRGKDVVFIGISLDEAKDRQKWLDFIEKEQLGGVQLHAAGCNKIRTDYEIRGIPHFLVFGKKGNLVSGDAPRPSTPDLKAMLEEELKK